jgi:hypothetical protein
MVINRIYEEIIKELNTGRPYYFACWAIIILGFAEGILSSSPTLPRMETKSMPIISETRLLYVV